MYELWFNLPKSSLHGVKVQAMKFHHKNTLPKNIVIVSFVKAVPQVLIDGNKKEKVCCGKYCNTTIPS